MATLKDTLLSVKAENQQSTVVQDDLSEDR